MGVWTKVLLASCAVAIAVAVGWPLVAQEREPAREARDREREADEEREAQERERHERPDAERREGWERDRRGREVADCRSCHIHSHMDEERGNSDPHHDPHREREDVGRDHRGDMIRHAAELLAEAGMHDIAHLIHQRLEQRHRRGGGEHGEEERRRRFDREEREREQDGPVTAEQLREVYERLEEQRRHLEELSRLVEELAGEREEREEREAGDEDRERDRRRDEDEREQDRERPRDRDQERPREGDGDDRETSVESQPVERDQPGEPAEKPAERDE